MMMMTTMMMMMYLGLYRMEERKGGEGRRRERKMCRAN